MRNSNLPVAVVAAVLCTCYLPTQPSASAAAPGLSHSKLGARDWSRHASQNLIDHPPSQKELEKFVAFVENAVTGDTLLGVPGGTYICSFRFADFRHSGSLSLFVGTGVVNRPSCRPLEVIDRIASGFELYQSGGSIGAGDDLSSRIRDLRHNGNLEFLLETGLASLTDRCSANWTAIFAWTGANYTNVSHQFGDFYREQLDLLNRVIPVLGQGSGSSEYTSDDKECLEAKAAAIQRFLRISPVAGIEQAIRLAPSKEGAERDLATEILGQIGTPEAREYLVKLTKDPDQNVASDAEYALTGSARGPMKIVPDSFEYAGSIKF